MLLSIFRPRQNGRCSADDLFKSIFLNENVWISIKISLKLVTKGSFDNIPALVQIMAWCWSGDKPLSQPMLVSLPTHICVTRSQWVKPSQLTPTQPYQKPTATWHWYLKSWVVISEWCKTVLVNHDLANHRHAIGQKKVMDLFLNVIQNCPRLSMTDFSHILSCICPMTSLACHGICQIIFMAWLIISGRNILLLLYWNFLVIKNGYVCGYVPYM